MKKVLVVLNGTLTPHHVVDTAIKFASNTSSSLHAVFVNYALDLAEYNYPFPNDLSLTRNNLTGKTIAEENAELLESNTKLFKDECQAANIDFYIEPDNEISLGRLMEHSSFSDFILADANENLHQYHIADLLVDAHCPVYLASKEVENVENIILTYDGSFSSIYAIKMYTYLFPELKGLSTALVYITSGRDYKLPQEENIKSWLSKHYSNVHIKILKGDIRIELVNYTKSIPNSLAVMGSFGRSAISRFFHKSLANTVIEDGKSSLFIAHE
ncbi:MAG TPA: universal stress protein [Chitinophagaceae bacterium]|nr:universal stress protein [Chitinophagaceae bacterium]